MGSDGEPSQVRGSAADVMVDCSLSHSEQTRNILKAHKANLEAMGSSLENALKVTVYMADIKTEKPAMNEVYAEFFSSNAPSRTAIGVDFPDVATRLEIELVAWVPNK